MPGMSLLAEQMLASQEIPCSVKFVTILYMKRLKVFKKIVE
jgi:hypothetical protein